MIKSKNVESTRLSQLCWIFCIVLSAVLIYQWDRIYFYQCTYPVIDGMTDFPAHIALALSHNDYSLSAYIIRILYFFFEEHRAQTVLSLLMTANHVFGVVTVWLLLRRLLPEIQGCYLMLAALLAHLCGPWIIPGYQTEIYLGACNGNLYHNMTILFSRSFIPLDFLFFFKCWDERHSKIGLKSWLCFTVCFTLTTMFKGSFAFAFLPMLAALLLHDLIKYRGRYFKNEVIIGLAVVPAGIACIVQYLVLFAEDFAGTSSQLALRFFWGAELIGMVIMYIRSFLLPIYTVGLQGPKEEKRGHISLFVLCTIIAIVEAVIFTETGYRANHGNFDWGSLALHPAAFALGIALLFRIPGSAAENKPGAAIKFAVGALLLLGHLATGVFFLRYFAEGLGFYV